MLESGEGGTVRLDRKLLVRDGPILDGLERGDHHLDRDRVLVELVSRPLAITGEPVEQHETAVDQPEVVAGGAGLRPNARGCSRGAACPSS